HKLSNIHRLLQEIGLACRWFGTRLCQTILSLCSPIAIRMNFVMEHSNDAVLEFPKLSFYVKEFRNYTSSPHFTKLRNVKPVTSTTNNIQVMHQLFRLLKIGRNVRIVHLHWRD
ncbi:hypothetical protein KSS87_020047, partial [Heliosperma pusillum]